MFLKGERYLSAVLAVSFIFFTFFTSCVSPKKISYFNYVPDSINNGAFPVQLAQYQDPKIQPNDILQISVQTIDPSATSMMGTQQAPATGGSAVNGQSGVSGYMVDQDGYIELPLAGRIKVGDMTTTEARNAIAKKAEQYYKNPVVNVRFANFTITVLGQVSRPGQIIVPNEKITLLDAIGLAGDIPASGKKDNILLARDEPGGKKFVRLSLNDPQLFQSPYFYLRQHDVIYVGPTKNAAAATDVTSTRIVPYITAGVSVITLIITLVKF